MAVSSLLLLIDDISTVLDDVATMSKVAAKKTAGVLGDDLALNAQQVSGIRAERELPVVWAVAKGSLRNKVILVPSALLISALAPWAISPLLMVGGAFLCFEGVEKIAHPFLHEDEEQPTAAEVLRAAGNAQVDLVALEADKVKGAVRTDFILSAEIVTITLGTVAGATLMEQVGVLSAVAVLMTIGVYGLVAGIVKLDDAGLYLTQRSGRAVQALGRVLLSAAPKLMKFLSIAGTIAMFLVGGGILMHGLPMAHHWGGAAREVVATMPAVGAWLAPVAPLVLDVVGGGIAGAVVLLGVKAVQGVWRRLRGVRT